MKMIAMVASNVSISRLFFYRQAIQDFLQGSAKFSKLARYGMGKFNNSRFLIARIHINLVFIVCSTFVFLFRFIIHKPKVKMVLDF